MITEQFEGELNLLRSMAQKLYYLHKYSTEVDRWKESDIYDELLTSSVEWHDEFFTEESKDETIRKLSAQLESARAVITANNLEVDNGLKTEPDGLEPGAGSSGSRSGGLDGDSGTGLTGSPDLGGKLT